MSICCIFGVDLNVCRSITLYCRLQVARIYFAETFLKTSHSASQRTSRLLAILPPSRGHVGNRYSVSYASMVSGNGLHSVVTQSMSISSGVTCTVYLVVCICVFGVTFWIDRTSGLRISLDDL